MFVCEMQCESVGKTQGRSQYSRLDGMLKHVLARYGDNEKDMPYNPEGTETEARPQCLENLIPFLFFVFLFCFDESGTVFFHTLYLSRLERTDS